MQCKATAVELCVQYNMSERNTDFSQTTKTRKIEKHFSMTLAFCKNSLMFLSCLILVWRPLWSFPKDNNISCNMEVFSSSL